MRFMMMAVPHSAEAATKMLEYEKALQKAEVLLHTMHCFHLPQGHGSRTRSARRR
jgi:hypothetical protein